ncbi:MAG: glycoside hydrolase family 2, partial [Clostridia bacterium]|nr:glycoside hydrolase family 2 [Clostridia bacterium]
VEPLRWYYHCDKLGMIVWQDMVSGGEYIGNYLAVVLGNLGKKVKDDDYERFKRDNEEWRNMFEDELEQMMDTLYNCVSIGCWVPFNEGWGQFDANRIAQKIKKTDPTRIVDHASGWFDQGGGDLKSVHKYILKVKMPKEKDERAFVLSEFGGLGRVVEDHSWNEKKANSYKVYKNKEALTKGYSDLYEKQIIPLVEKGLSALVYTQVTDVENEVNGIMTYDRDIIKIDGEKIQEINKKLLSITIK